MTSPVSASPVGPSPVGLEAGLTVDPLFLGVTRPPMCYGVTYLGIVVIIVLTMELFLLTRNLLTLLLVIPLHGLCRLLCARDARIFDLLFLAARTRLPGWLAGARRWQSSSYAPLSLRRRTRVRELPRPILERAP